jgi:DNA processing protein
MFPVRNQTMAGLSKLIIVIEAKKKSGSLITAYSGLREGRDIAAVPGEIDSILSEGTNDLIKRGAYPITSSDDVLDILNIERKNYLHNM